MPSAWPALVKADCSAASSVASSVASALRSAAASSATVAESSASCVVASSSCAAVIAAGSVNSAGAPDVAAIVTPPVVVVTSALAMNASTSTPISFVATETPIEIATPVWPATEPASEAAAATDDTLAPFEALIEMLAAVTEPAVPSPSMYARTSAAMRLEALTPAPLAEPPDLPLAAIAIEPAATFASIVCVAVAVSVSAPPAKTLVSLR